MPNALEIHAEQLTVIGDQLITLSRTASENTTVILDWLRVEFGLDKPGSALSQPRELDADAFAAAVRKALPKSRKL